MLLALLNPLPTKVISIIQTILYDNCILLLSSQSKETQEGTCKCSRTQIQE